MDYEPKLFQVIAAQVITGEPEQYLYASACGMTAMFSAPQVADAINRAVGAMKDPLAVIRAEYQLLPGARNCVLADGVTGLIDVGGVLVEVAVRQLGKSSWRVLFSRVDAMALYTGLTDRIDALSQRLSDLERTASAA